MSVKRPQTTSFLFAILTLFATAAWGQQNGDDLPVFKADDAVFGKDSLTNTDLFKKASLESATEPTSASKAKAEINKYGEIDSLFGSSNKPLVNKDGYFIAAGSGEMWKDVTAEPLRPTRWTPPSQVAKPQVANAATDGETAATGIEAFETGSDSVLERSGATIEPAPQPFDHDSQGPGKLRLRIGFDAVYFQRGDAENTVFATNDDGNEWAFSDFNFSKGSARYFIQFMGDDQSGLELTFFDIEASPSLEASGDNVVPFFFQALPAGNASSYDLDYTSRLKNIELNSWIRQNERQRSGWGLRHINLDESFDVVTNNVNTGLFSRTDNDLWGINRMWERRRPMLNRLTATGGVDAGLYLNRVSIDVDTLNIDDNSEADNIAGTLGFNLGLEYLVADHVTIRCGYEGFGLFGVASGSTQSLEQDLFNGLNDPELGSIYFGGFYFGAIAAF